MALPLILGAAALIAAGVGAKKGYDGHQTKSKANELIDKLKYLDEESREELESSANQTQEKLDAYGMKQAEFGQSYAEFKQIAEDLLKDLNARNNSDLVLTAVPKYELEKMDKFSISAVEFLGTLTGAGVAGAGAAFATYSGVMALGAASTGTAISSLAGVAATNATMAALGGGSIAAGGLGMAGGAAVLGGVVAGPVLAIAGWAYNAHAEKAYEAALTAEEEALKVFEKRENIKESQRNLRRYVRQLLNEIDRINDIFSGYKEYLVGVSHLIEHNPELIDSLKDSIIEKIENGYKLAAILVDIIVTPLYKTKTVTTLKGDEIEFIKDENDCNVINERGIKATLKKAKAEVLA